MAIDIVFKSGGGNGKHKLKEWNKDNAELQQTDPGTKDKGNFITVFSNTMPKREQTWHGYFNYQQSTFIDYNWQLWEKKPNNLDDRGPGMSNSYFHRNCKTK